MPTIIEMVNHTRLDCVIGAATGYARRASRRRIHHTAHRSAFGSADRPAADAQRARRPRVESEAATISAMRLARAYDEVAAGDEEAPSFRRLATRSSSTGSASARPRTRSRPRVPRRQRLRRGVGDAAPLPREPAQLDLGGLGQRPVPRRAAGDGQEPGLGRGLLRRGRSRAPAPSRASTPTSPPCATSSRATSTTIEARARRIVERMALALQASLLVRYGDPAVADAFCASRLAGDWGHAFGTLPAGHRLQPHHRAPPAAGLSLRLVSGELSRTALAPAAPARPARR